MPIYVLANCDMPVKYKCSIPFVYFAHMSKRKKQSGYTRDYIWASPVRVYLYGTELLNF